MFFHVFPLVALFMPAYGYNDCSIDEMKKIGVDFFTGNLPFAMISCPACANCDKYFHCKMNYNAVYNCKGPDREETAKLISDLREYFMPGNDSEDDQMANRFGRSGGDCGARYLEANGCPYNPKTKVCICPKTETTKAPNDVYDPPARPVPLQEYNNCSVYQMKDVFLEFNRVFKTYVFNRSNPCNVTFNCDKWFHCTANYNAVYKCNGTNRAETAKFLADAREYYFPREDSGDDQEANRFGRSGGDCSARYLEANGCPFIPETGVIPESECHANYTQKVTPTKSGLLLQMNSARPSAGATNEINPLVVIFSLMGALFLAVTLAFLVFTLNKRRMRPELIPLLS